MPAALELGAGLDVVLVLIRADGGGGGVDVGHVPQHGGGVGGAARPGGGQLIAAPPAPGLEAPQGGHTPHGLQLQGVVEADRIHQLVGDQQATQMQRTYEVAKHRLKDMEEQRDELNEAIDDLREQLKWGEQFLTDLTTQKDAAQ